MADNPNVDQKVSFREALDKKNDSVQPNSVKGHTRNKITVKGAKGTRIKFHRRKSG